MNELKKNNSNKAFKLKNLRKGSHQQHSMTEGSSSLAMLKYQT